MRGLVAAGALKEDELLSELERPHSARFSLALSVLGDSRSWDATTRAALERAFGSHHPASAAKVLWLFLGEGELSPADPRLPQVLACVSLEERRKALTLLAMTRDVDLTPLAPQYVELLSTPGLALDYLPAALAKSKVGREWLAKAGIEIPAAG